MAVASFDRAGRRAHPRHGRLGRPLQRDRRSIRRGREGDGAERFLVDSRERRNSPACQTAPSLLGDRRFDEGLRRQRICRAFAQRAGCDGLGGRNVSHWRAMGGRSRGFLAGIILLTSLGTFTLGRIVMPEPLFSAFIAAALYCALRGADAASAPPPVVFRILAFRITGQLHKRLARDSLSAGDRGVGGCFLQTTPRSHARIGFVAGRFALRDDQSSLVHLHGSSFPRLPSQSSRCRAAWPSRRRRHARHVLYRCSSLAVPPPAAGMAFSLVAGNHQRGSAVDNHFRRSILSRSELSMRESSSPGWQSSLARCCSRDSDKIITPCRCGPRLRWRSHGCWNARDSKPCSSSFAILLGAGSRFGLRRLPSWHPSANAAALAERATAWTTIINFDRAVWTSLRTTAWFALGGALLLALLGLFSRPQSLSWLPLPLRRFAWIWVR